MNHVLRAALVFGLSIVLTACATSGPKPAKSISKADKAYKAANYEECLKNFELVIDTAPQILNRNRYREQIDIYRDAQIHYGLAKAQEAEKNGRLLDAWVWYVQTSQVSDDREECGQARTEALRVKKAIAEEHVSKGQAALDSGSYAEALVESAQGLWFGGGSASATMFAKASGSAAGSTTIEEIQDAEVAGMVRTDSLTRLKDEPVFKPYGTPIYFGDARQYYSVMGAVRVKGRPFTQKVPESLAKQDALYKLSRKAQKAGADAIIKVHIWTKRKKAYTDGELVKFGQFDAANASATVPTGQQ